MTVTKSKEIVLYLRSTIHDEEVVRRDWYSGKAHEELERQYKG